MPVLTREVSPRALAVLAGEGDRVAFGRLWTRSRRILFGEVRGRAESLAVAEDVVSQTYLQAYAAWPRYVDRGAGTAWLVQIARRLLIDRHRSAYTRHTVLTGQLVDVPAAGIDPADWAVSSHQAAQVHLALADIPPLQAECVTWRYLADRTVAETAAAMCCSATSVKDLQRRGLDNLRAHPLICALRGS